MESSSWVSLVSMASCLMACFSSCRVQGLTIQITSNHWQAPDNSMYYILESSISNHSAPYTFCSPLSVQQSSACPQQDYHSVRGTPRPDLGHQNHEPGGKAEQNEWRSYDFLEWPPYYYTCNRTGDLFLFIKKYWDCPTKGCSICLSMLTFKKFPPIWWPANSHPPSSSPLSYDS